MKLWLDDVRPAPEGWHWVRTAIEALMWMITGVVEEASLDHDLGGVPANHGGTYDFSLPNGGDLVTWMVERNLFPHRITVHSWNVIAFARMVKPLMAAVQDRRLDVQICHRPMAQP
jgi:hypothetical protein